MKIKFKKHSNKAVIPTKGSEHAGGFDIVATSREYITEDNTVKYISYGTDLSVEIPQGFCGFLYPRSSITNKGLSLGNSVGIIDADYRGTISFRMYPVSLGDGDYEVGERIGQLVVLPIPDLEFVEVKELSETHRGEGSYGSTGK